MNFENGQKKAQPFGLANSNLRIQIQFMHATFHVFLLLVYSALRHVNSGLVFYREFCSLFLSAVV